MRRHLFFHLIAFYLLGFSLPILADQLIVEPDMGRAPLINLINETRYSLDVVMYGLTDESLLNALIKQKVKGKTVKIILEKHPYQAENQNDKAIRTLVQHHIAWQGTAPPFSLTHQKTLIIDNKKAVIMTFNFTHNTFKNDRNFALVIDDPKRVKEISAIFDADWNQQKTATDLPDLIVSPDNSRKQLLGLIRQAKHTISVYAQTISDYKIVGALANAAKKGIKVDMLTSSSLRKKQINYLLRAGVRLHQSKKRYIHAKVFIFDRQKAMIGSINLTRHSLDNNRELSVVTEDQTVINQLNKVFEKDLRETNRLSSLFTLKKEYRLVRKYFHRLKMATL